MAIDCAAVRPKMASDSVAARLVSSETLADGCRG
jgi:hypothetical protein